MLISFEVENYRSIKEPITLLMSAVNYYKESANQLISKKLPGLTGVRYLRTCAIYGPNASGKTALWRAFRTMQTMVLQGASIAASAPCPYTPFGLDKESRNKPTRFAIVFVAGKDRTRFEYSFAYKEHAVVSEELLAFPKGFKQVWFSRTNEGQNTKIKGSATIKITNATRQLLNDNMLLLSLLCNLPKTESYDAIRPVGEWFDIQLDLYSRAPDAPNDFPYSGEIIEGEEGSPSMRSLIQDMMRRADVGISRADVEKRQVPDELREFIVNKMDIPQDVLQNGVKTVVFQHKTKRGEMKIDFADESDGTRQLFGLSGHVATALEKGGVLFVDEIDASLHPVLVTEVVRLFLDPKSNPLGAQLLFTAHNPCLLENGLLRRDQVWFTEKNSSGATQLYPLSDYSPRKGETVLAGYLTGRYSAIPVIPKCFGLCSACEEG